MIWIFGDSFSCRFERHLELKNQWAIDYCDYKKKIPKTFGDIVGTSLKMDVNNLSKAGSDNYSIFHSFIKYIDEIKENDVVIFMWSSSLRYRLAGKHNEFLSIVPETDLRKLKDETLIDEYFSQSTLDDLLLNRNHQMYYNEINDFIKIIRKSIKNKNLYHLSGFHLIRDEINDIENLSPGTISIETHDNIKNEHFGEIGHFSLATYLLKKIRAND
jgi:MoaA/NifB/PqqE/SkfB family radical SAM enzyme